MVDRESSERDASTPSRVAPEAEHDFGDLRHYVPGDLLNVSFPVAVRGYDRGSVDAYVRRVNRAIAELRVSASPTAAVRHAIDQAEGKVDGLLQSAREAAEQITTSAQEEAQENADRLKAEAVKFVVDTNAEVDRLKAEADELTAKARVDAEATLGKAEAEASRMLTEARAEAKDTLARSQAEADERRGQVEKELAALQKAAETRLGEIRNDTQAVWRERDQMLDGIRAMANELANVATASVARLQPSQVAPTGSESPDASAGDHDEGTAAATDESASTVPVGTPGSSRKSRRRG
jgi:DivIVA domain-containing protein